MTRRALLVTPGYTIVDGHPTDPGSAVRATPEDTWARGLGALLDRIARTFDGEGVLLLDRAAAHALKLPAGPEESTTVGQDDARAAGWLSSRMHAWTPFHQEGRPRVIVGIMSWPDFDRSPLVDVRSPMSTVYRLLMWQDLTGVAWQGNPSVAGATVLKRTAPTWKVRGSDVPPAYGYRQGPDASEAYELDFDPEDWSRPQTLRYAHGYDSTRMYLAAAQTCERLAPWTLRRTGRIPFSPKLGGWWKVELGPWNFPLLPAPAGPGESVRWVTTPTLELLSQLRDAGEEFQDFEVLDSWTGDGKRILRGWGETLETAYQKARPVAEDEDAELIDGDGRPEDARAVMKAVKSAYRECWGLLNRTSEDSEGKNVNATYRPDWHYAILAQARCNLWRRLRAVGKAEDRWPTVIEVDNAWYESDVADPERAKPAGIPLVNRQGVTDALGTFKVKGTREKGKGR